VTATVFYGIVPNDAASGESFAYPWRMRTECNEEDALDLVQGLGLDGYATSARDYDEKLERGAAWRKRLEARRDRVARPVTFLRTGPNETSERYVLAIRDSVREDVDIGYPLRYAAACPAEYDVAEWPRRIDEWATKLGIPREVRGESGWFAILNGGGE
jgi:hypothetical protein